MTKQTQVRSTEEALERALEELDEGHIYLAYGYIQEALASEAIEQPAQDEPVAWISTSPARMIHWTSDIPAYGDDWIPLYTSPPAQRTWVGLTDEEMQALWDRYAHMEMMRAIEAKLKEKNT